MNLEKAKDAALIFSTYSDNSAAGVQWGLKKNGVVPIWVPSISQHEGTPFSVSVSEVESLNVQWAFEDLRLKSVWYRRPQKPVPPVACAPCDEKFVASEWLSLQKDFFGLPADVVPTLWVNEPDAAMRAESKLLQLQAAREIGLAFPATLVSNDPRKVKWFIEKHQKVIVKTFTPHVWHGEVDGVLFGTTASLLDASSHLDDNAIALCPAIYQPLVDKVCDIRVTIIGDRLFPARFTSVHGGAMLDWRPSTFMPDLQTEACALPTRIERKLLQLQARLGLVFGCVDLAVDRDGNVIFFEVNQSGQWMFVEQLAPSIPLLKSMCALLSQGRVDYSLDTAADISYREFRSTDDYQEWARIARQETSGLHGARKPSTQTPAHA